MNFISILYALFLLSALGIYWSVGRQQLRLWTLLIASLVFYASLSVPYIPLLLALTFINFRLGREIGKNTAPGQHNLNWQMSNEEWQFAQIDWNRRR
ncbi:MBOAT family protein, partial [Nostoc sp. NIES-2111]